VNTIDKAINSNWIAALCALAIVATPIALFFVALPALGNLAAQHVPIEWERHLGKAILNDPILLLKPSKIALAKQSEIKARFVRLAQTAGKPNATLEFRDGLPNAMALPNDIVIVTDGLINQLEDGDLIDAVIAHELGHLIYRHGIKNLVGIELFRTIIVRIIGGSQVTSETLGAIHQTLLFPSMSREKEKQADHFAHHLLKKTGSTPMAFAQALEKLQAFYQNTRVQEGSYTSSHPLSSERITQAIEAAEKQTP
jgi:predicted Zn-dependent protease